VTAVPRAGRVIAGRAAGRLLVGAGAGTRPLSDRVKEQLFAILEPELPGAAVLDLCAGSGAAGIEALSRGAARVDFVDVSPRAVEAIRRNLAATGLAGPMVRIFRADARGHLISPEADGPFDLVFVDPPYHRADLLGALLEALGGPASGRVRPGGRVVARTHWRGAPPERVGLLGSERRLRVGEAVVTLYRRLREPPGEGG
jgi:16S rRNA (guanine966-N2)-methyltransferase